MVSRPVAAALGLALSACTTPGLLRQFERTLAAQDSATGALTQWCAARHIADPAIVAAIPIRDADAASPGNLRALLAIGPAEPVRYRHVRLACGGHALSEAHNWYVPGRLTQGMNAALDSSDTPFGGVAAPLHFTRQRLAAVKGRAPGCPRGTILSHRAMLRLPGGSPISLVLECYTPATIADWTGNQ